ncbi:hypothetical protein AB0I72_18955 [Nocardiopsis sp. NPDC049922]|uniref:hypothetical protein n=1 Tax=Nocardiopsis sp. NPDC049922 TaxID=3155157 RepID=UPI0033C52725
MPPPVARRTGATTVFSLLGGGALVSVALSLGAHPGVGMLLCGGALLCAWALATRPHGRGAVREHPVELHGGPFDGRRVSAREPDVVRRGRGIELPHLGRRVRYLPDADGRLRHADG